MTNVTTKADSSHSEGETAVHLFANWFDPIETGLRGRIREFIKELIHGELDAGAVLVENFRKEIRSICSIPPMRDGRPDATAAYAVAIGFGRYAFVNRSTLPNKDEVMELFD